MARAIRTTTEDGRSVRVDARDVARWAGLAPPAGTPDERWVERAALYVREHPRRGSAGIGAAQRLALLRRLAAGPATTEELLDALRTVGWVGADDLENRLRELRASDGRAGEAAVGLAVSSRAGRYELSEPFPTLEQADLRALGFAKAILSQLDGPLAATAGAALDALVPGLTAHGAPRTGASHRARAADYERFEAARLERRGVRVRYFSLNSGREGRYLLVPVEYVTVGAAIKALCVRVDEAGHRVEDFERQFAMDRLLEVTPVEGQPPTDEADLQLARSRIVLEVSSVLAEVLRQRNIFGLAEADAAQSLGYEDAWRVTGTFPKALAWDVMEQLCAWAGQAQVREPLWLVNAVVRRLRAGLRVMEEGAAFDLVKPELDRPFADHGEAVRSDEALPEPTGPRKLAPRPRTAS